jgi:quercetin dioxygenase-like cupin family protein
VYRITSFPPDSEFDRSQGYSDARGPLAGSIALVDSGGIPGLHVTETVDLVTMLSGELWAVMETGETVLRPGDTLVHRGTKHAWSNRTDKPAVMVSLMIDAASRPTEQ